MARQTNTTSFQRFVEEKGFHSHMHLSPHGNLERRPKLSIARPIFPRFPSVLD
jgi:hypothetical protein